MQGIVSSSAARKGWTKKCYAFSPTTGFSTDWCHAIIVVWTHIWVEPRFDPNDESELGGVWERCVLWSPRRRALTLWQRICTCTVQWTGHTYAAYLHMIQLHLESLILLGCFSGQLISHLQISLIKTTEMIVCKPLLQSYTVHGRKTLAYYSWGTGTGTGVLDHGYMRTYNGYVRSRL